MLRIPERFLGNCQRFKFDTTCNACLPYASLQKLNEEVIDKKHVIEFLQLKFKERSGNYYELFILNNGFPRL